MKKKPYSFGKDIRGDFALFLPDKTRLDNPTLLKKLETAGEQRAYRMTPKGFKKMKTNDVFFRMIDDKGKEISAHGWMRYNARKKLAEITQWG